MLSLVKAKLPRQMGQNDLGNLPPARTSHLHPMSHPPPTMAAPQPCPAVPHLWWAPSPQGVNTTGQPSPVGTHPGLLPARGPAWGHQNTPQGS